VPEMQQAIQAYKQITVSPEFREIERMREKARLDEKQALHHARVQERKEFAEKWQGVVAEKDAQIAQLQARLEGLP